LVMLWIELRDGWLAVWQLNPGSVLLLDKWRDEVKWLHSHAVMTWTVLIIFWRVLFGAMSWPEPEGNFRGGRMAPGSEFWPL